MSDFDAVELTAAGSGKSEAEVAFELLSKLKGQGVWGERNMGDILDMYAECLDAAKGLRAYEGQKRVEVPIQQPRGQTPATQQQPAPVRQPSTAPAQTSPQPQAVPQAQPVHAQQQAVAQAYKPAS